MPSTADRAKRREHERPAGDEDRAESTVSTHELLMDILERIRMTEQEALLKGYFSDLTTTEMHTLQAIGLYDQPSMGETARRLGVTTGTLSVAIRKLVAKGYVAHDRLPEDRRVVRLQLTRKGKLASRMYGKFHRLLVEHLMEPLNEEEQEVLLRTLERVSVYIREQFEKYRERDPIPERERRIRSPDYIDGDGKYRPLRRD